MPKHTIQQFQEALSRLLSFYRDLQAIDVAEELETQAQALRETATDDE